MPEETPETAPVSEEQRRTLRFLTLGAVSITLWTFTSAASARNVYALRFGANDWQIGLINALPQLMMALQVFCVRWVQRHGKKRLLFPCLALSAVLLSGQCLAPYVAERYSDATALWFLMGLIGVAALVWVPGQTAWFPLLNDCVPAPVRGRYFARMRTWWLSTTVVAMLIFMVLIGKGDEAPISRYQILFAFSFIWALGVIAAYWRLPESASERETSFLSSRQVWAAVLRDRPFLLFLLGHTLVSCLWMTLIVFSAAYMKRELGYPEWLLIFSYPFAWALGSMTVLWLWGRMVDHAGNRAVFTITLSLLVAICLGWAFVLSRSVAGMVLMGVLSVLAGVAWSGYFVAATRQCLTMAPRENQTPYTSAWMMGRALGFAAGPFLAGLLLDALGRASVLEVHPGTWHLNRYTLVFALSSVGFAVAALALRRLRAPGETTTRRIASRFIARLVSWR